MNYKAAYKIQQRQEAINHIARVYNQDASLIGFLANHSLVKI